MNWVPPDSDRIAYCNALLEASRRCMLATQGSMVSVEETLANSMARISSSKELVSRADDRLQSYGALVSRHMNPRVCERTGEFHSQLGK